LEHSSAIQDKVNRMRALVWHGSDTLSVEELPEPEAGDGEVLFNVAFAGICGSDLHQYRGHPGPRRPPLVLGHEAVGTVEQRPGQFALFPLVACGTCGACERGEAQLCQRRGLLGLDRQGVFAEQIAVSEDALVPVAESLDPRAATLVEPLATSVSALRLDGVTAGSSLLIVGAGPIGLLGVFAAAQLGASIVVVEPLPHRRELALRLGADEVFADASALQPGSVDAAIDAVGIEPAWSGAISAVRSGGTVSVVGLGQSEGSIAMGDIVRRGITVRGHYAYTRGDFDAALALLESSPPPIDWVEVVGLDDAPDGFRRLVHEPDTVTKVLVEVAA
jgi:threonine dehydrogenase-like Zn-dependent dehydrogenase